MGCGQVRNSKALSDCMSKDLYLCVQAARMQRMKTFDCALSFSCHIMWCACGRLCRLLRVSAGFQVPKHILLDKKWWNYVELRNGQWDVHISPRDAPALPASFHDGVVEAAGHVSETIVDSYTI